MKVIVSKEEDGHALLLQMQVSEQALKARFTQQSKHEEHVVSECYRRVNYDLVTWLQAQGFAVSR